MKGLVRLSGISMGLKVARFGLGIVSAMLLTRLMPIHDFGVYAYVLVVASLLAIPGEAGMPNLVIREITRAQSDGDLPKVRGIIRFANLTVIALTAAMAVAYFILLLIAGDAIPAEIAYPLAAVFPALLLGALANTRAGILRGLGSPIASQVPEQIVRPVGVILFALLVWAVVGGSLTAFEGVIVYSLASAAAFAYGTALLVRTYREKVGSGTFKVDVKPWLRALVPFAAIAGLQVALVQISAFILGLYAEPSEVALFRIATLASDFALFSTLAINSIVAPQIAGHHHRGEDDQLQSLIARVNRLNLLFAVAVVAGLVLLGRWALQLGFGEEYEAAYLPMCILAFGHLVGAGMGYVTVIANMSGREKLTVWAAAFGFSLNTIFSLILCPIYGALGAAIAAAITAVVWRLALSILLYRLLRVRAWAIKWGFGLGN